jgi:L-lactate dehydrogenase
MRTDEVAVTALRSSQLPNSAVHRSPAFFEQASTARSANGALISRFDRHVDEQSCEHGFDHEGRNHWCGKGWLCLCSRRCRARSARAIVLVDRTRKRAKAVATDLRYGSPLCPKATIVDGDYDDLADAALVMITAGINEKAGGATDRNDPEGRLWLLDKNAEIYRDIVPRIVRAAPGAVILVITDPPDPLADIARTSAGHDRVLIPAPSSIACVSVFTWESILTSMPIRLRHKSLESMEFRRCFCGQPHALPAYRLTNSSRSAAKRIDDVHRQVEMSVRYANIAIIEGNGASQFGIGIVAARIAEMVLRDERAVIPIGRYNDRFGVTLSLPGIVGRGGVLRTFEPEMSREEQQALVLSAASLRKSLGRN